MLLPFIGLSQDILISEGGTINTCSGTLLDSGELAETILVMKIIL